MVEFQIKYKQGTRGGRVEKRSWEFAITTQPNNPPKMKIVALLSGGKDSCYNLVHCAANGHALVAAASLGPGPGMGTGFTSAR